MKDKLKTAVKEHGLPAIKAGINAIPLVGGTIATTAQSGAIQTRVLTMTKGGQQYA